MLALYPDPDLADTLTVPGGLPADELHVTIAYCGDASTVDLTALTAAAGELVDRPPVQAALSGHARFTGGPQDVIVALLDSPGLDDLRADALAALDSAGIDVPRDHGFTAHATLRYQDAEDPDPLWRMPARPVTFTHLAVVHGDGRTNLPFRQDTETSHPIVPYAREAYMAGWAASGGPWTPHVLAGCAAAAAWAAAHASQQDVFEVTLKLGQLEGMWAVIYKRRHDTITAKTTPVMDTWRTIVHRLNARSLVSKYRAQSGLHGETADPHRRNRKTEATAAALAWLLGMLDDPAYGTLLTEVADALQAGLAEGDAGARLIAADEAGIPAGGLDIDAMFTDAYDAMKNLPSLPGMASEWVQRIIAGNAADLGQALSSLLADGASYQDMLDTVMKVTGSADVRAVSVLMDYAISGAYAKGALRLYTSEGLTLVDWLTAGDSRVCMTCENNAGQGPYPPDQFPDCPAHPLCVTGSTRVGVPPGLVVPADVDSDLASTRVDVAAGTASASAMTQSGFDFGRGHIRAVTDREYVGDVVTIRTAAGYELTATPNHPVATRNGWVPVTELVVGDHVLCSTGAEWRSATVDPDVDDVPPRIEQVAESFAVELGPMPTAAEDFHGDGTGSKVHVVRADRLLVEDSQSGFAEHVREHDLGRRDVAVGGSLLLHTARSRFKELGSLGNTANRVMGCASKPGAILGTGPGHPHGHGLAAPARLDTAQTRPDGLSADTEGFCERLAALASDVTADDLVYIKRHRFRGHVYNLDTVGGWYISNGIVTHNCRCTPAPADPLPVSVFTQYLTGGDGVG